ncbi:unnamed protein product [Rhodiola kirilowii]
MAEDVQLCISYCRQSVDPITGRSQKIDKLWEKIHNDFHQNWISGGNQPRAEPRSQVALASRFAKLKPNLVFWSSCIAFARRNPESGCNLQDEIRKAQTKYFSKKKEFIHFPCWEEVKDHQTFGMTETSTPPTYNYHASPLHDELPTNEVPTQMRFDDQTFSTPNTNSEISLSPSRPVGVKAAKEARRKGKQTMTSTIKRDAALEKLANTQEAFMNWQQKEDQEDKEMQKNFLNLRKLEEETKIMQMNTEVMTPMSKRYFSKRKAAILQSYEEENVGDTVGEFSNCYRPLNFDD